jgi:hypothetical protein
MNALLKDVQIMPRREESVKGMEQSSYANYAAAKNALIKLNEKECVKGTGQRSNFAAAKDAQIKSKREECAKDTGPTADEVLPPSEISTKFSSQFG